MIESLSIAVHAFVSRESMSFSVDETLLSRWVNLSTSFREAPSERSAAGIGLHVNAHKTEYMCYNQTGNITTLEDIVQIYILFKSTNNKSKQNYNFFARLFNAGRLL